MYSFIIYHTKVLLKKTAIFTFSDIRGKQMQNVSLTCIYFSYRVYKLMAELYFMFVCWTLPSDLTNMLGAVTVWGRSKEHLGCVD